MLLAITIAILAGIVAGTITGMTPGIHINLVALILLSLVQATNLNPLYAIMFILVMATTHTFIDFIPSVFLGAPDPSTVLSVLPGHKLLFEGKGFEAIMISVYGSIIGLLAIIFLTPFIIKAIPPLYNIIERFIPYILVLAVILIISKERSKTIAILIFLMSGCLGLGVLNINLSQPLFPLLSGLFGTSGLLLSLKDNVKLPKQKFTYPKINNYQYKVLGSGFIASLLTGFLPGLGAAQAAIIGSSVLKKTKPTDFIFLTGTINTMVMIIGLIAFITINKTRNGAIVVISKLIPSLNIDTTLLLIGTVLVAGGISSFLAILLAKHFTKIIQHVNYRLLCISIILFITFLVFILTSWLGLFVLLVSTATGILPPLLGVQRNNLMGCLIIPVTLFFIFSSTV
ncbi:hypothetical protein CL622_05165 [archaeon]|nr:hypothetical protein [archaeon]|tara:strand:+ start:99 stop:1298 length:1200 start_codon:yes stop_codon:yes gene_type:complete